MDEPPGRRGDALSGPAGPRWPGLDEVVDRVLTSPPRLGGVRVVAVDGPAGSGKTTLAAAVAGRLAERGAEVGTVHLDDLYEGWSGLDGVWDRLREQVLDPLGQGRAGRYRRYDWDAAVWAEWVDVPVPDVLVLEGCGAAQRAVDPLAVLRLWVETTAQERLARGLARDGAGLRSQWLRWMEEESAHFAAEATRERADVRFTT